MIHKKRRQALLKRLGENALVIISTNPHKRRNGDVYYPFRPDSDFWYLSGFTEPEAVMVFSQHYYHIFLRPKDVGKTVWDGDVLGLDAASEALLADKALAIQSLKTLLPQYLENAADVYYQSKSNCDDNTLDKLLKKIPHQPLAPHLAEMRLVKTRDEVGLIKRAVDISIKAHEQAMKQTISGLYEYEIAGIFSGFFAQNNVQHAYPPIVAAGENALVLHYINNDKILKTGQLLLIDAGCEVEGYAADITRTFPIDGKFTKAQKQIYQIVLEAQLAAIDAIKPGEFVNTPHKIATQIITQGLLDLGVLQDKKNVKDFFMHGTGHWLGLDVHDVGEYKQANQYRKFTAGMLTTVEPGIYIRQNDKINPIYWHIGIRIEDNVLLTQTGNTVLTSALVKQIDDIESLMSK